MDGRGSYTILGFQFKWLVLAYFFFIFVNKEYAIKDQMMRLISRFWDIVLRYEILRYFYGAHARLFFLFPFLHFGVNKSYLFIN